MLTLNPFTKKPLRFASVLSFGLVILFLISIFALPLHRHDDSSFHSDCPICLSVNLPVLINEIADFSQPLSRVINYNIPETRILISKQSEDLIDPRAPPAL